ncbi:MAG TPA: hypothetical protein PL089_09400 [Ignavibacteria bacterium]|nr:hypothetical protein [Ignavibacteria bacterium]
MKHDILKNNSEFLRFRKSLLLYGRKFNIPYEDVEEIANDAIVKAIQDFIEDRGNFESFCKVIFKRRLINFQKTIKANYFLLIIDEDEIFRNADGDDYENFEKNRISKEFIESVKDSFSDEEKNFFEILYQVCEQTDIKLIAEASRIIGVSNAKGWDIFRKIQRKSMKKWIENNYDLPNEICYQKSSKLKTAVEDSYDIVSEDNIIYSSISPVKFREDENHYDLNFKNIFKNISDQDLDKLIKFYQ